MSKCILFLLAGIAGNLILSKIAPAETITIMAANTTTGDNQSYQGPGIRIFQGLQPDVVLIQEFKYESGSLRDLVDTAFGTEYHYYCEPAGAGDIPNGIVSRWNILTSGAWEDTEVSNRSFAWAIIDIPGEKNLQAVSIHLLTSSARDRASQAGQLKTYIEDKFDPDQYIVVGGDLNVDSRGEAAIDTFKTFLSADNHIPADRNLNSNTNLKREKPYDWVMPNDELDQYHTTLYVGTEDQEFSEGIVFDSRVFDPISEVPPIEKGDSEPYQKNMQHMAVMKAFELDPVPTPIPSPSPSPTPEPVIPPPYIYTEGFDNFQNGSRPSGWSFINCNQNSDTYTGQGQFGIELPSIKFNPSGATVTTPEFAGGRQMTFWLKGLSNNPSDTLLIEEFYSEGWQPLYSFNNLPQSAGQSGPWDLNPATTQLRFSYSESSGHLAFDDVFINTYTPSPTPTPSVSPSPTSTPTPSPSIPPSPTPTASHIPTPSPKPTASPSPPTPSPTPIPPLGAVVGDYNGNGTTDLAIFRPSLALWKIRNLTSIYFGASGDQPVPQDYDGDGTWDLAYFRPSSNLWKIKDLTRIYFGTSSDAQVPGDYDGDGTVEPAYFRPSTTLWNVRNQTRIYFGTSSDEPLNGDFNGDGTDDPTFFRSSNGLWKVRNLTSVYFGTSEDILVPADYNGDGTDDFAWYRPSSTLWKVKNLTRIYYATSGDTVFAGDFDGDGSADYGYFRPASILWKIKDITRVYFGQSTDTQISNPY